MLTLLRFWSILRNAGRCRAARWLHASCCTLLLEGSRILLLQLSFCCASMVELLVRGQL